MLLIQGLEYIFPGRFVLCIVLIFITRLFNFSTAALRFVMIYFFQSGCLFLTFAPFFGRGFGAFGGIAWLPSEYTLYFANGFGITSFFCMTIKPKENLPA